MASKERTKETVVGVRRIWPNILGVKAQEESMSKGVWATSEIWKTETVSPRADRELVLLTFLYYSNESHAGFLCNRAVIQEMNAVSSLWVSNNLLWQQIGPSTNYIINKY